MESKTQNELEMDCNRKDSSNIQKSEEGNSKDMKGQFKPSEKWRIMKNIVVISLAFMVHFTAFQGAGNLQSSVNAEEGLGTASLATIYFALILSNVFLPVVIIRKFGCKWAIAVSFIAYNALYRGTILRQILHYDTSRSANLIKVPAETLVVRFFGIFFMIFQFAQVWGNLISSLVFSSGETKPLFSNVSAICGKNFCPGNEVNENSNMEKPPDEQIYIVAGIYLACMISACLIVAFGVDNLKRYNEGKREGSGTGLSGFSLLAITLKLLKERNQILILPITMFLGVEQAFVGADYTAAYVACAWGISNIGYVMICYGITNSISAITMGSIVKLTGRVPVVCGAFVLHLGILIALLCWAPTPDDKILFFVVTGLWGICDGVWLVQINGKCVCVCVCASYCGILFPSKEEAAYSNYRLWQSLGFIVQYIYSSYICLNIKIYILITIMVIGMTGYLFIEINEKRKAKLNLQLQL
ncbi:hypothetical protein L9F63_011296 [Diploptera punctata]|uniref:UNC93-like protein n=1 Tax=Diploptera punctata TaxID=6984 RepID=A0AAD8EQ24_DIPPU|nr:hypothetical protein L9F63_011296 [Diploptera punctata]